MKVYRDYVKEASDGKWAIGHFNFATVEMLRGIVEGAKEMGTPVIVGLSEGERAFFGVKEARAVVSAFRDDFGLPIFLNADHTKSFERAKEVIDAGFDSIVVDGSSLPYSENVELVKKVISYVKESGRDILVEGELGFIGTSSAILEELPPGVAIEESKMTSVEEAEKFVKDTEINLLAPAVGNIHGVIREGGNPPLLIKRVAELNSSVGVPLVLHGASGIADKNVIEAVSAGISIVHFSTDLRVAFRRSLASGLSENPDEVSPYKYLRGSIKTVKDVVVKKISLIQNL